MSRSRFANPNDRFDLARTIPHAAKTDKEDWYDIKFAWRFFRHAKWRKMKAAADLVLRRMVTRVDTADLPRLRERIVEMGWGKDFLAMLEDAVRWRRSLETMSLAQVYGLVKELRPTEKAQGNSILETLRRSLGHSLRGQLADLRHVPAVFDDAVEDLKRKHPIVQKHAAYDMGDLAHNAGYLPAQLVFLENSIKRAKAAKEESDAKGYWMAAYYWLLKAVRQDPSLRPRLEKLAATLTPAQKAEAQDLLKTYKYKGRR